VVLVVLVWWYRLRLSRASAEPLSEPLKSWRTGGLDDAELEDLLRSWHPILALLAIGWGSRNAASPPAPIMWPTYIYIYIHTHTPCATQVFMMRLCEDAARTIVGGK